MKRGLELRTQLHMIIGAIFLLTVVLAATACRQVVHVFYKDYVLEEKGAAIARTLAGPAAKCVVGDRWSELNSYLAAFSIENSKEGRFRVDVRYAFVLKGDGLLYASSGASDVRFEQDALAREALKAGPLSPVITKTGEDKTYIRGSALDFAVPLASGGRLVGVLRFGLALDRADILYWRTTFALTLALFGFLSVIWLALYVTLRGRILGPILQLSDALHRVREGDLTTQLRIERYDELGALAESLNTLVERLKTQKLLQVQLSEAKSLVSSHEALAEAHREQAKAYDKLKEMQDRLIQNEKHASLGRLVRGVAHEINNPLNTVKNSLGPLKHAFERVHQTAQESAAQGAEFLDEETMEDLKDIEALCAIIERGVGRAVAIVRDLRSFSSLGIQELKPVSLGQVIDTALEACKNELGPGERVHVAVEIDSETGLIMLDGHQNLLVQLFVNLITNAAQAIDGEGKISIYSTRRHDPERIFIQIEDDGPGIPEAVQNKIFEPFFTTKEAGKGSGLGLSLCLGIVEKHAGKIEVSSELTKGTIFTIDLATTQSKVSMQAVSRFD
jgi:signal transduction histidine kinase